MEMSLLNRLNCYIEKFNEIYKNVNDGKFAEKNRYSEMLPFEFNRVKLDKQARPFQSLIKSVSTNTGSSKALD